MKGMIVVHIAIFAVTPRGGEIAARLNTALDGSRVFIKERDFDRLRSIVDDAFNKFDAHIFIGAVGIAVRMIAPHIVSKLSDPAVIAVDERGLHVISLLSGHVGGANDLTRKIAAILNAAPIITTATDVEQLTAVDAFTSDLGLMPRPKEAIKMINRAVLDGKKIFVTDGETELELVPQKLIAGIGCKRGTSRELIAAAVERACAMIGQSIERIGLIASIDVKNDEIGLIDFARSIDRPIKFFDAAILQSTVKRYMLDESDFVKNQVGVGNVCEAAALSSVERGRLALSKTKFDGVTVALIWDRSDQY